MTKPPEPLTHADCDLSDFQYMELDVRRLRDSKFAASGSGEGFRAGVLLWCAAWHQKPAASLPDDDIELANLAGYGRVVKEWKKVRDQALNGFVKCSDGRLYHTVIAEKAATAFAAKEKHAYGKLLERIRKENVKRKTENKPLIGSPTFEQWKSGEYPNGIPAEDQTNSAGIPPENPLRGNGEGTERERNGEGDLFNTGADAPAADGGPSKAELTKIELWTAGKSLLESAGMPKGQCGTFVGKLVKDYGDLIVIDAVRAAVVTQPADPAQYLKATCMQLVGQRSQAEPAWRAEQRARMQEAAPGVAAIPAQTFFEVEARDVTTPRLG